MNSGVVRYVAMFLGFLPGVCDVVWCAVLLVISGLVGFDLWGLVV